MHLRRRLTASPSSAHRRTRTALHVAARLLLVFACVPLQPAAYAGDGAFRTPAISAAELAARQGTPELPLVVDVRPAGEYKAGHIAGAINAPVTQLDKHLAEIADAKNGVVLYCTSGKRTRTAEGLLLDRGITGITHLDGGYGSWLQGRHPVNTGWGP
ncbi:MAG: rhodanese-like domain-containing protein [Gammaproteobacteria bacterium]|nr:rhodanese-like domain-containing protein [Gammaproteobacteria bacterium]